MRRLTFLAAGLAALPAAAEAEVKNIASNGFFLESKAVVPVAPAAAYAALGRIGQWWNKDHSYSGDAANLRLELKAGGCLCEMTPANGGGVEHMRVVYAAPGTELRLQGGLGPLQNEAVAGTLTWAFKAVPGGTEITQTYVVGGYIRAGAAAFAMPVDQVLSEQLGRLASHLGPRPPASTTPGKTCYGLGATPPAGPRGRA